MPRIELKTAILTYGHTRALKEGVIGSEKVVLDFVEVSPITSAFRRMVRGLEFDVCEMALSTYLCARAHGKPITALPIYLLRRFEHGGMVYNTRSGIRSPADLHGRRVGLRSYTLTPGVWMRGILQSSYGVELDQVTWVLFGDEHVAEYVAPPNVISAPQGSDMIDMLLAGEIDAAIGAGNPGSPDIRPIIPDPVNTAINHFRQTGIYPISHVVVVKSELLERDPGLAPEIYRLFDQAKEQYLAKLRNGAEAGPEDAAMNQMRKVVGDDPLLYGVSPNRHTLETFIEFNVDQGVIPERVSLREMFPTAVSPED